MSDLTVQVSEAKNDSPTPESILSFVNDMPNICSLAGLLSAVFAIYFAAIGLFPAAMIGLIWAVFFDWGDGFIARRMNSRSKKQQEFGGQLDSLIDLISFGICPAVVLLSYSNFSPWFIPGAFCIVAAGALRLSYFNVFGLVGKSTYQGLALDNNAMILVLLFVFEGYIGPTVFSVLLYIVLLTLAMLNVASIKTPKFSGNNWYIGITAYTVLLTLVFGWQLLGTK